jgi:antitoxin component of MazEF toxin-antitoxin module
MKILKVRRLGDSNIVVIPREFERLGYTPGDRVVVEALPTGEILIRPADQLRATMDRLAARVVAADKEALDILAAHDRDRPAPSTG